MSRKVSPQGLWTDTDGFILPYVTILLVVIIGVSALAVDGARFVSLESQLQHGADQLALAAAAELDTKPDAITRADNALTTTLASFRTRTLFGTGSDLNVSCPIDATCRRYLSSLPASDATIPIPNSVVTTDPLLAHFVEVTVTPVTIPTVFPVSFFGGSTFPARSTAVAGAHKNLCQFTPMYVCNPYEPVGNTDYQHATDLLVANDVADPDAIQHRQMISMRYSPGNFDQPGNYGFLDVPGTGCGGLGCGTVNGVARVRPGTCLNASGVNTQTGLGGSAIANAFNVRFDRYQGSMSGHSNDADYAPALDVRKGYLNDNKTCGNNPNIGPTTATESLPQDTCTGTCSTVGTGNYDISTSATSYWQVEHPTALSAAPTPTAGNPVPSRYSVYKYEIAKGTNPGGLNDKSQGTTATNGELGRPKCNTKVPPTDVDRRILVTAVLNCRALAAAGTFSGGHQTNLPVAGYAKMFLLQPVDGTGSIFSEFTGLIKNSDVPPPPPTTVQLYR